MAVEISHWRMEFNRKKNVSKKQRGFYSTHRVCMFMPLPFF